MSLPRFYISPEFWSETSPVLEGDEARHCSQVMRRGVGDAVMLFDGKGAWARATILLAAKERVDLRVEEAGKSPPPVVSISLLQAIPKGSNMDFIIEKAVELGAAEIIPVFSERTVVKLDAKDAAKKREKWQRLALEACKQCGQNWLPQVRTPVSYEAAWAQLPAHNMRLVAALQEDARSIKETLAAMSGKDGASASLSVLMVIGPEGDLSPAEYDLARAQGCRPVTLGSIVLRVETAALYCLSVLRHELG